MAGSARGHSIDTIPTPALVLDAATVRRNIARMATYTKAVGIANRPHTKTHKSIAIAGLQLAAGATGLTVAKAGEAEVLSLAFADRQPDILVAYPVVDPARTVRLAALARNATIRVAVDSSEAIAALSAAAREAGTTIGILVDLDVGSGRTGVPTADRLVALAEAVDRAPGLRLDGIFYYPGHVTVLPESQDAPLGLPDCVCRRRIGHVRSENLENWLERRYRAERPAPGYPEDSQGGFTECGILGFGSCTSMPVLCTRLWTPMGSGLRRYSTVRRHEADPAPNAWRHSGFRSASAFSRALRSAISASIFFRNSPVVRDHESQRAMSAFASSYDSP